MVSAGDKLVAATELLKHVLLYFDDPRELFKVQRVGRRFFDTIEGSVALQQQLGTVERPAPPGTELSEPLTHIHPFLYPINRLDYGRSMRRPPNGYGPKYCEPHEPSVNYCELEDHPGEGYLMRFSLQLRDKLRLQPGDQRIGFNNDHKQHDRTFDKGSWRNARVSTTAKAVEVKVCVIMLRDLHFGCGDVSSYWDSLVSADRTMTLGEMVDFLDARRSRSGEEHLQRLKEEIRYVRGLAAQAKMKPRGGRAKLRPGSSRRGGGT